MGLRTAAVVAAGSISLAVLVGCDNGQPDPSSEGFTGASSTNLSVLASTNCQSGRIGPGDTVRVSGFDYVPDSTVKLRWTVPNDNTTGLFPSVTSDEKGDFSSTVKVARTIATPGDTVLITSEGSGPDGLMVLRAELEVGAC